LNEIRFIDLFSGIGGFRLGLKRANNYMETEQPRGKRRNKNKERSSSDPSIRSMDTNDPFRCVWSNDFNKYANQVYTKHFGEEGHYSADIRGVNPEEIPDFDLLCSGFPCQAFSVAGKRKGFQDTRGTLFFEICRIAEAKRPSLLLLENVKGLLSHDGGRTFTIILQSLDELGYWLEWQVLNSKYFGVPQNRERVFIVGHLGARCSRPIFPISHVNQNNSERNKKEPWGQIGVTLSGKSAGGQNARGNYVLTPRETSTALDANYWKGHDKHDARTMILHNIYKGFNEKIRVFKDYSPTIRTSKGGGHLPSLLDGFKIRRLTPIECERLQGFPDRWTEGVSDTQRYRLLGNAVTVNVIEFLGEIIKSQFTNESDQK